MEEPSRRTLWARMSRNMSWTFAGQLFISLAAVATLFITARALGPASLGILALVEILRAHRRSDPADRAVAGGHALCHPGAGAPR